MLNCQIVSVIKTNQVIIITLLLFTSLNVTRFNNSTPRASKQMCESNLIRIIKL